ncbi:ABC transporter permease [Paraburkholderia diazotrophica]|uniref:Osmoprotectant transport system permease protein n=1 Tax=Paraburkholderia diazotrophica TaxID=667676 RepID=A0A1H6YVP2_9BURK|nr:ABC transporter permease [Paraburkholderia diazotrophica]SEJ45328.1 osmoprotectant transport system permease protein [Paraburkholderia diazotrophica]
MNTRKKALFSRCVALAACTAPALAHAENLLASIGQYRGDILYQSIQQMTMVAIAGGLAIIVAVPLGIYLSRASGKQAHVAQAVLQTINVGQAVPKLALLALAMSVLGIGRWPSIFGLWVATLLPIVLNTLEGLRAVPPALIEAATGMGMTPTQILLRVELPNALYVIFAGIRTALAITVGTAPLAFLVGGGGLGELIFTGIDMNDFSMLLAGAIPTALLAILTDLLVGQMQAHLVSKGVNPQR